MTPSLYIHIPLCTKKCDYCDFFSVIPENIHTAELVVEALKKELTHRCKEYKIESWKTIYIGGGTPSLLETSQIRRLCESIINSIAPISFDPKIEWTIEANPEDLTIEWLEACAESGINRISVGIQSMTDSVLQESGRRGSRKANLTALQLLQTHWHGRLSLDFIAGLPKQTKEGLIQDIKEAIFDNVDHISLYSLMIEDGTALEKKISHNEIIIPDEDDASDMWIAGRDYLESMGFIQYEVSNFSKKGFESRHNTSYWNMTNWLAIGPSASATIINGSVATRYTNKKKLKQWLQNPENSAEIEIIQKKDLLSETLIMGFRILNGIDRNAFKLRFGKDITEYIGKTINLWHKKKLVSISDEHVSLTPKGLLFLNSFLCDCLQELN